MEVIKNVPLVNTAPTGLIIDNVEVVITESNPNNFSVIVLFSS